MPEIVEVDDENNLDLLKMVRSVSNNNHETFTSPKSLN